MYGGGTLRLPPSSANHVAFEHGKHQLCACSRPFSRQLCRRWLSSAPSRLRSQCSPGGPVALPEFRPLLSNVPPHVEFPSYHFRDRWCLRNAADSSALRREGRGASL